MTENKRFNLRAGYYHEYTGIGRCTDENLTTNKAVDLLNELSEENKKLKKYNKSQELEIIRLHNLADVMSTVLRELGIYDVYNDEQIENVKRRVK